MQFKTQSNPQEKRKMGLEAGRSKPDLKFNEKPTCFPSEEKEATIILVSTKKVIKA